jgi:aminopeptidase N
MTHTRRSGFAPHCTIVLAVALAGGRAPAAGIDLGPIDPSFDYHSFANVDQFRATHMELDLRIDIEHKTLTGVVALEFKRLDPRATEIVLDTKGLRISEVMQKATDVLGATSKSEAIWVSRPFHLDKPDPILGSALVIELPASKKPVESIRIDYDTEASTALQWLTKKEIPGRKTGLMYSQAEPIGTRSWIPLQDTPQVRMTYKANVHTSSDVRALMSAENDPKAKRNGEYSFLMTQAVPAYLIALAVGDFHYVETGPRTGVYAEKSLIKAAAKQFADAEAMIEAGEKLIGPYRWTRYDIVVLPANFPVGSMANPRLSFISSTLVVGDASLVAVPARALAHSWSGNLVGNSTWRDLWLNEGFSEYLQARLVGALYGESQESMDALLGLKLLREDMARLPSADQALAVDWRDRDPALAFSEVPREKGRLFLNFLEAKFGRERFDAFLKVYFDHFAFKSITTEEFVAYLKANLIERFPGMVTAAQVDGWVNGPGLPADLAPPVPARFEAVDEARRSWLGGNPLPKKFGYAWVTEQWAYFLDNMPAVLTATQLRDLDQACGFGSTQNAEIAAGWFALVIAADYQPAYPRLEEFLDDTGRLELILPLYAQLMKSTSGAEFANRVYAKARLRYHPYAAAAIDAIVMPADES